MTIVRDFNELRRKFELLTAININYKTFDFNLNKKKNKSDSLLS